MPVVNVNGDGDTVASSVSADTTLISTFDAGSAVNTTVNVSVDPDSETPVDPLDSVTVKPHGSAVVAVTVWSDNESKLLSELPSTTARVIVVSWEPSIVSSSTPVTVTV